MPHSRTALGLALGLLCTLHVSAALQWEHTVLEFEAAPFAEQVEAVFKFTNTGLAPVTISDTQASCGCTVPSLAQRDFAPAESGELRVMFALGENVGRQEKTITVKSTGAEQTTDVLTLRVVIPTLFEMQPRFQTWRLGEAPATKVITIRALRAELTRPLAVASKNADFAAELREEPDQPGVFTVAITPAQTAAAMFTSLTVATSGPAGNGPELTLYATVR